MKIYVASSWRNQVQPDVVAALRAHGHEVYDFKNPPERTAFAWSEIDPNWEKWTPLNWIEGLKHPRAVDGFNSDFGAMKWADAGVLVMPCGRSAHIEAGYFVGGKKPLWILMAPSEPELMYSMATGLLTSLEALCVTISEYEGDTVESEDRL